MRKKVGRLYSGPQSNTDSFAAEKEDQTIQDRTETNLVNLRRIIYLTIMNALNYEEAVHKLLKVQLQEGQEVFGPFRTPPVISHSCV